MIRILITLLLSFSVFSYAQVQPSLLSAYSSYLTNANAQNISQTFEQYFTKAAVEDLNIEDTATKEQLLFKNFMAVTISVYESHSDSFGCLSVNGKNSSNDPITFNIEYITDQGRALMSHIDMQLHNSIGDFPTEATCPKEYMTL